MFTSPTTTTTNILLPPPLSTNNNPTTTMMKKNSFQTSSSFPYGVRASKLLEDLKRADWLPTYDEEGVRQVVEEGLSLLKLMDDLAPDRDITPLANNIPLFTSVLTLDHAKSRNKRCLMAYHHYRLDVLEKLYWERGIPILDKKFADKLSSREIDYYRDYVELITNFGMDLDMDLLSDMTPPKDLIVEVRALRDFGEVMLTNGFVRLTKDSTHYILRADAEPLIRQNVLEQI
jgi:GINS complex subunit 1